jgi:hypothetical protein
MEDSTIHRAERIRLERRGDIDEYDESESVVETTAQFEL